MSEEIKEVRYSYIFDDDIEKGSVQELIDKLDEKRNVDLYFSTHGGCIKSANTLVEYLNKRSDIKVIIDSFLMSSGVLMLRYFKGVIEMRDSFELAIIHVGDYEEYSRRHDELAKYRKPILDLSNKQDLQWCKKAFELTAKECKEYRDGKDVIISRQRIKKFLKERK